MKILWITNFTLPEVAEVTKVGTVTSGGWLIDLSKRISKDKNIELYIASFYNGKEIKYVKVEGRTHILIPGRSKAMNFSNYKSKKYWKEIYNKIKPDIFHIHGTEYVHGLSLLSLYPSVPTVITIQGVMKRISEEYYGSYSGFEVFKYTKLKELLTFNNHLIKKRLYKSRVKTEQQMIKNVKYITGRTFWDYSIIKNINPDIEYFKLNYNLREVFYNEKKWNYEIMQKHTVFSSASSYPLKGLDILIDAIYLVKKKYSNVKLFIPGGGNVKNNRYIKETGYQRNIRKKIERLKLENNIVFLGNIDAKEVARNLQKANVFVVSSAIEGASASLCEAMYIGTPSIGTYRGGITELINDENGFYYDFPEYSVLANRIIELFESKELCEKFSINAIEDATKKHDREKNTDEHIKMYEYILKKHKDINK